MTSISKQRLESRKRRHHRVRKKITGSAERPRLVVTRSLRHMVVQVVDDSTGRTLASASSMETDLRGRGMKGMMRHAASLGLNADAFGQCLDSSKYGERVRDGVSQGGELGVNSTPTIFINGRRLSGAQPYEVFAGIIDEELAR